MLDFIEVFTNETLPEKLNNLELEQEFAKMIYGDMQARDKIIVHNIKLVIDRINKVFYKTAIEYQDLISIGLIGLINAVDTFDYKKSVKFSTYAVRCIDNEIIRALRKKSNSPHISYEDIVFQNDKDNIYPLDKILPDLSVNFVSEIEEQEVKEIVQKIVTELSPLEKQVVEMYYGLKDEKPHFQQEIADALHYSHQNISLILIHALSFIKDRLKSMEILETNNDLTRKKK